MLDEIGKFFLEEVIGESLGGLIRRAHSRMSRRLKIAAWLCLIASIAFFIVAARWPQWMRPEVAVAAGLTTTVAAFVLGLWASAVHARSERQTA